MELLKIYDQVGEVYGYNYFSLPGKYHDAKYNKYFNFMLKHMDMENRIFYTNTIIEKLWAQWQQMHDEANGKYRNGNIMDVLASNRNIIFHYYTLRDFVANLRRIVDDCMQLYCIATNKFKKNNGIIESLGDYLNEKDRLKDFDKDYDFLKELNELSNACKHSFGAEQNKFGAKEPCIFVYSTTPIKTEDKKNILSYSIKELGYSIDNLVKQFNVFFYNFNQILKAI